MKKDNMSKRVKKVSEKVSEKVLEARFAKEIELLGGQCIKLAGLFITGYPDRLVLLPEAKSCFAEIKTTGGKLSARQVLVHTQLRALGFEVFVIECDRSLSAAVTAVEGMMLFD